MTSFGSKGLRTLMICQKEVDEQFYTKWAKDF